MLQRRESNEGVVWYESPLLREIGVCHAFSTRIGGVSTGVFSSLNFGNPSGCPEQDPRANIHENERRLLQAAGFGPAPLEVCRVHQVHGAVVASACRGVKHDPHQQADSLVCDDPARVVSVRTADCVPVVLASADGRAVAAVHAGWRGVVAGVVVRTVAALRRLAGPPLIGAIGAGIGMDAFEVGPEVVDELASAFARPRSTLSFVRPGRADRWHVDLASAIAEQLRQLGIDSIDTTDRCTFRDATEFFSHRRERGVTGRMAALIAPRAESPQR